MKSESINTKVFISSPFAGNVVSNVEKAKKYCAYAVNEGYIPYAPHLFFPQFMNDNDVHQRQLGIHMGKEFLKICKEVWVFGERVSAGMADEIELANMLGIPIRFFTDECMEVE